MSALVKAMSRPLLFVLLAALLLAAGPGRSAATSLFHSLQRRTTSPANRQEAVAELERETLAIGAVIRERSDREAQLPVGRISWPAPGYREITSEYGLREHPVLGTNLKHDGIDIGAPEQAPVAACLDGTVLMVDELDAYGRVVVIDHGGGLSSVYAHLASASVKEGQRVKQGAQIGRAGTTGEVTGPHLHFELRQDGDPVDPLTYLYRQAARLPVSV